MYRDPAQHPLLVVAFNKKVFGVERASGTVRWRVELESGWDSPTVIDLAIDPTTVIACSTHELAFLDYQTGAVRKRVRRTDETKGDRPSMLIDGGQLFIAGHGTIACYSIEGDLLWDSAFDGEGMGQTAIGFPHRVRQADL